MIMSSENQRFTLVASLLAALLIATTILVAEANIPSRAEFIAGVLITVVLASPIEWAIHRYVCHSRYPVLQSIHAMHNEHHLQSLRLNERQSADGAIFDSSTSYLASRKLWEHLGRTCFYGFFGGVLICLPAGLIARNPFYIAGIIFTVVTLSALTSVMHEIAHGTHQISAFGIRWFYAIFERHRLHHLNSTNNLNLLIPLGDVLMGTFCGEREQRNAASLLAEAVTISDSIEGLPTGQEQLRFSSNLLTLNRYE